MKYSTKWQKINDDDDKYETTDRLKIPNGWIVRSKIYCGVSGHNSVHTIEDPQHLWEIN